MKGGCATMDTSSFDCGQTYVCLPIFTRPVCFYLQIGIKKEWLSHDNQSSVNLKSNTMKNTMQRYGFFAIVQYF